MFSTGLASVSFPYVPYEMVIKVAAKANLKYIEWESDAHAPNKDAAKLRKIASFQKNFRIECCAYGTGFRLGETPIEELPEYIQAAKLLGTKVLRVWAGKKSPWKWSEEGRKALFAECKLAAKIARKAGVVLCLECHKNTYTETKECALELMRAVNSPAFRMNWRPNYECMVEENIAYIRMLKDYIIQVRIFHRSGLRRLPLENGIEEWQLYLKEFSSNQLLLLEYMPDHEVGTLRREAGTLHSIVGCK